MFINGGYGHSSLTKLFSSVLRQQHHLQIHASNFINFHPLSSSSTKMDTQQVFVSFPQESSSDIALCNSKLKALSKQNQHTQLLSFFNRMRNIGILPNCFTLPLVIKSCTNSTQSHLLHSFCLKLGYMANPYVTTSLLTIYSDSIPSAYNLFTSLPYKNIISWTSMLSIFVLHGDLSSARRIFSAAPDPDIVLWNTMASAYAAAGDITAAMELFSSMPEKDTIAYNSMLKALAEAGEMESCVELFNKIPNTNIFSWNILISGYSRAGRSREVLSCFRKMVRSEVEPDEGIMAGVLSACGKAGTLPEGRRAHGYVEKIGLSSKTYVGNALIDMYGRCGEMKKGIEVFRRMGEEKDVVSWNTMIKGMAENGDGRGVTAVLGGMKKAGAEEDGATMAGVLWACAHMGMVKEGVEYVMRMVEEGVEIEVVHFGCLVDMLARAGMVEEAVKVVERMRETDEVVWTALMGGCRVHGRLEVGEMAAKRLGEGDSGRNVMLCNMYGGEGRWGEVARVRVAGRDGGMKKTAGMSLVEVEEGGAVEFLSGDGKHPRSEEIYLALIGLSKVCRSHGWMEEEELLGNGL